MRIVLVPGTWANTGRDAPQDSWWLPSSPFAQALISLGHEPLSFTWDTALDGVIGPDTDWIKAADRLWQQCKDLEPVNLIAHSHGGQLPFFAAEEHGLKISSLVTMATPVRSEVPYGLGRHFIGRWVHIYGGKKDYTQIFGELALFRFGALRRQMKLADANIEISECGHSDLHTVEVWNRHNLWAELQ